MFYSNDCICIHLHDTQHCFNVTSHTTLQYQGMMKDVVVIFWWIDWLVQSNLLYFGFFHQSSMTVPPEVVSVVTGGIVATQGRVLAVAMMALETDKCHKGGANQPRLLSQQSLFGNYVPRSQHEGAACINLRSRAKNLLIQRRAREPLRHQGRSESALPSNYGRQKAEISLILTRIDDCFLMHKCDLQCALRFPCRLPTESPSSP